MESGHLLALKKVGSHNYLQ